MCLLRRALPALFLTGVLAACGAGDDQPASSGESVTSTSETTTTSTTEAAAACSAAALSDSRTDDQPDLPRSVADARSAVLDAALACDLVRLEELSLGGDGQFTYSFGQTGPAGLAEHLRAREAEGEEIVRLLVETLRLPYVSEGTYAWPSAHSAAPGDRDWEALRGLYTDEQIAEWRAPGSSGFLGYRVGFTAAGDWQFFVAGD